MTPDSKARVERRLAAAQCKLRAGAFDAALALLAEADSEATDEITHARVDLVRGLVAGASNTGSEAPLQLLRAAQRLEPLDIVLARQTYLDAWGAALFAGHLASSGGDIVEVSRAACTAPRPHEPMGPFDDLLDGLAILITESRAAAAPTLRRAVSVLLDNDSCQPRTGFTGESASSAAVTLWDFEAWSGRAVTRLTSLVTAARSAMLSIALNGHAMIAAWSGDFETAAALVAEDNAINEATGTHIAPYGAMLLAAYQGRMAEASRLIAATIEDSVVRGEGLGVDLAALDGRDPQQRRVALRRGVGHGVAGELGDSRALHLGMDAARADRSGRAMRTTGYRHRSATGTDAVRESSHQRLGTGSRSTFAGDARVRQGRRGLVSRGDRPPGRTRIRTELARAHLVFGEWLRRETRRVDAREQLRIAHDLFIAMQADGFAERTRRELVATGEHIRKRGDDTRTRLTDHEDHIARLVRDGRTNAEIAAELFISARAPSSGTCERSSPSSTSGHDESSRAHCPAAFRARSPRDRPNPKSVALPVENARDVARC